MTILHVDFSGQYNDDMGYQMNYLSRQNVIDGHKTYVAVTDECFENGIVKVYGLRRPETYTNSYGVVVTRFPSVRIAGNYISSKIRMVRGIYKYLVNVSPDVVIYHGIGGLSLIPVVKYKKKHPHIKFYADCHADYFNSAQNWVSKNILHKLLHAPISRYAYKHIEKLLVINAESWAFLTGLYRLPEDKLELYPLGGVIIEGSEREDKRGRKRRELGLSDTDILLCHTGKLDAPKRTTDILDALYSVKDDRLKLIVIGSILDDIKEEAEEKIKRDSRVRYLGWKNGDELLEYICASDLYVQPGSYSATMQNSICCGAPVMIAPFEGYKPFLQGNGWFVKTVDDIASVFGEISQNPEILNEMSQNSYRLAHELLDYRKLAARLYV